MAVISFHLNDRTARNGMVAIRLRICHRNTNSWHSTGVTIEPDCFNRGSLYDPIQRKAFMYDLKREQLMAIVRKFEEGVYDLRKADGGEQQLDAMTAQQLRDYIFGVRQPKPTAAQMVSSRRKAGKASFMDFFDKYGQQRLTDRSRENYAYVWRLLYQYMRARDMQCLLFADITYSLLTDIKAWLRSTGRGEATRFKVESYIRAAYREGLRMKLCNRDNDPFLDYKIEPVPERDIEVISREQLRALMAWNDEAHPGLQRARDVLLASFYLCGINFQDMYSLPMGDEACYIRHKVERKTQRSVHIRVEPELKEIVSKYEGGGRMFNFGANMRSLQYRLDDNFRALSDMLGFRVNMAIIRRTWATLAAEIECPDTVINHSMGHIVRSVNARFYEQYDWSRTARWNRRVIDYVKGTYPHG